jgi:hypothetical protein
MSAVVTNAFIRCTCPRCCGLRYMSMREWFVAHRDIDQIFEHEATIELPPLVDPDHSACRFIGSRIEDCHAENSVLVTVWADRGVAEVAFRQFRHETWGPPITCFAT